MGGKPVEVMADSTSNTEKMARSIFVPGNLTMTMRTNTTAEQMIIKRTYHLNTSDCHTFLNLPLMVM